MLTGLDHVQICTGYTTATASALDYFRADMDTLAEVEPIYETLPGWKQDISQVRRFEELPDEAQQYVKRLEEAGRRRRSGWSAWGRSGTRRLIR